MAGFAGFDSSEFLGAAAMAWLKANTNLLWSGYYLGPAPSHASQSWMGNRAVLVGAGWGLAPVYVGQQIGGPGRHVVSSTQGNLDGHDAAGLMKKEGFPAGSYVYLDLEDGPPFVSPRTDYVKAWADAVTAEGFKAGIYCSHGFAADAHTLCPDARIWAYKVETTAVHTFPGTNFPDPHPAGCGYPGAFAWQLGQNCRLNLAGEIPAMLVDLNSAMTPDPSR